MYPIFLSDFNKIWSFPTDFLESPISNFTEIGPVGAALTHADRRTDGRIDKRKDGRFKTKGRFSQSYGRA